MSTILELQELIQDTTAELSRLERRVAARPESETLRITGESLRKRLANLEAEFRHLAEQLEVDVCVYRIPYDVRPRIAGITDALSGFQRLFSTIYDSLRNGPRVNVASSQSVLSETEFGLAYTFTGSIGAVLTLPNERLLVGETFLDEAMSTLFDMTKVKEPRDVVQYSNRLGRGAVRLLYDWANGQVKAGLGAEIEWKRGEKVRASLLVQEPELEHLRDTIAASSDEVMEELPPVEVQLLGGDVKSHTFHMETPYGDIRGRFGDAIDETHVASFPARYLAVLRRTTTTKYSTDEQEHSWFLMSLEAIVVPDSAKPE